MAFTLPENVKGIIDRYSEEVPVRVGALARELGLDIKVTTLKPGISGEIGPDDNAPSRYKIRINRHESKGRQRFTAAHEIAHFLLHKHLIGNGLEDTVLYRSRLSNVVEAQANKLAAEILMPISKVRMEAEKYSQLDDEAKVDKLAKVFDVSTAAMRIRLGIS